MYMKYRVGDRVYARRDLKGCRVDKYTPGIISRIDRWGNFQVRFGDKTAYNYAKSAFKRCTNCEECPARFVCFTNLVIENKDEVLDWNLQRSFYVAVVRKDHVCRVCGKKINKYDRAWRSDSVKATYCLKCGVPQMTLRNEKQWKDAYEPS